MKEKKITRIFRKKHAYAFDMDIGEKGEIVRCMDLFDEDHWDTVKYLGCKTMAPSEIRKHFLEHEMEDKPYDKVNENCQEWVLTFLNKISGKLVEKLPRQFKKTLGGKLTAFSTKVKSAFTGDTE